jgi:hypothetical protein
MCGLQFVSAFQSNFSAMGWMGVVIAIVMVVFCFLLPPLFLSVLIDGSYVAVDRVFARCFRSFCFEWSATHSPSSRSAANEISCGSAAPVSTELLLRCSVDSDSSCLQWVEPCFRLLRFRLICFLMFCTCLRGTWPLAAQQNASGKSNLQWTNRVNENMYTKRAAHEPTSLKRGRERRRRWGDGRRD